MLFNNNGQIAHTITRLEGQDNSKSDHTTDGIFPNLDYSISYQVSYRQKRSASLNLKGFQLIEGFGVVMRLIYSSHGSYDLLAARELASAVTNIWASLVIDKSAAMRTKLVDQYGEHSVRNVWDMMRGNGKKRNHLKSLIAGYMFIRKMADDDTKFDPEFRFLCVSDVSTPETFMTDWEEQPVTKRLGIRSLEQFREICRNGLIVPVWKTADQLKSERPGNSPLETAMQVS
jgi:hypothetical protein